MLNAHVLQRGDDNDEQCGLMAAWLATVKKAGDLDSTVISWGPVPCAADVSPVGKAKLVN